MLFGFGLAGLMMLGLVFGPADEDEESLEVDDSGQGDVDDDPDQPGSVEPDPVEPDLDQSVPRRLDGTDGDDWLDGSDGEDIINGRGGHDDIRGGRGNDVVRGGDGHDVLYGDYSATGFGDDTVDGGRGDDFIAGDGGNDVLRGGNGNDTMLGGDGDDTLRGGRGTDWLSGNAGDDKLIAGYGEDDLSGDDGNDVLIAAEHDGVRDWLHGGNGDDTLTGVSDDFLEGGAGADLFDLPADAIAGHPPAVLGDFNAAEDRIQISLPADRLAEARLSLDHSPDGSALLLLNGQAIAHIVDARGLDPAQISLRAT